MHVSRFTRNDVIEEASVIARASGDTSYRECRLLQPELLLEFFAVSGFRALANSLWQAVPLPTWNMAYSAIHTVAMLCNIHCRASLPCRIQLDAFIREYVNLYNHDDTLTQLCSVFIKQKSIDNQG